MAADASTSSTPGPWRGESVQSFAAALGLDETAVYPATSGSGAPGPGAASKAKRRRRRRIWTALAALLALALLGGGGAFVAHERALASQYEEAWERYSALATEQDTVLDEANILAEECRLAVEDTAECDRLDSAILDAERGFPRLEKASASRERIEELEDATAIGESTLARLREALSDVEADMKDQVAGLLSVALGEAREVRESVSSALDSVGAALEEVEASSLLGVQENADYEDDSSATARLRAASNEAQEVRTSAEQTLSRLDSRIATAEAMLGEGEVVRLAEGVSVAEASDVARVLRQSSQEAQEEREELLYAADLLTVRLSAAQDARRLAEMEEEAARAEAANPPAAYSNPVGQGTGYTQGDATGTGAGTGAGANTESNGSEDSSATGTTEGGGTGESGEAP